MPHLSTFDGIITDIKIHDHCLSPAEIEQEVKNAQRLRNIQLYVSLVETEGPRFLFGGPEYKGPIISEFVRNALFLTGEVSNLLDAKEA